MNAPLPQAAAFDTVDLELGGARIIIPTRTLAKAMLERLLAGAVQATVGVPNIGEYWEAKGGVYGGVVRGIGGPDRFVIWAHTVDARDSGWQTAYDWAEGLQVNGFSDWSLPTRAQQALAFANVPELFEKEFYWSCEQRAEDPDYAWGAYFFDGSQGYYHEGFKYRARAVRSEPIQ